MDALDYWRLCDELNIIQAALLIAGVDPSSDQAYVESWEIDHRPAGYEPARSALSRACIDGELEGNYVPLTGFDIKGNPTEPKDGSIDLEASTVKVADLKIWLSKHTIHSKFFFPEGPRTPDYLDRDHPRFAPKLAAAVNAWLAIDSDLDLGGRSPKQALLKWLGEHGADYGLINDDGNPNEQGIQECAKVANWQERGGAPRTPASKGNTPKR